MDMDTEMEGQEANPQEEGRSWLDQQKFIGKEVLASIFTGGTGETDDKVMSVLGKIGTAVVMGGMAHVIAEAPPAVVQGVDPATAATWMLGWGAAMFLTFCGITAADRQKERAVRREIEEQKSLNNQG